MDRAVLVGINRYPGAPLMGCVNDVLDMARFVTNSAVRFNPSAVRMLTDERATAPAILERLEWLTTGLKAGDRILFQFSGHGAQVATRNPMGEVDGLDEALCGVTFDWTDRTMIRDKQLYELFGRIPEGVTAMFVSDSCHSGGLTRSSTGLGGRAARVYPVPPDIGWRVESATLRGYQINETPYPNIALISGSRSDQTSADAIFSGRPSGAMTYCLIQALREPDGLTVPLPIIVKRVQDSLAEQNFSQVPQLEGPESMFDRPFLL